MGKWDIKNMGAICQLSYGKNLATSFFTSDGYKVFGANSNIGFYSKYTHENEEVLVSSRGEYSGVINYSEPKSYITNNSIVCRLKLDIDKRFLFYALKNIPRHSFVSGSAQPQVVIQDLEKVEVYYPEDKPEQTRIAQILSKADAAIAQTEALIAKYQRIKTGLMQDLLTRGIDEHGNIRNKTTHRFEVKNGIEAPEEWEVLEIGEITEHVGSGITPKGGSNVYGHEGILLIRSQNVLIGEFGLDDVAFITPEINERMQRSELQDLDVLLNITGASIGRSHFVPINFPKSNVNQHVCALRIKNRSVGKSLFVSSFLNSYIGQKQIKRSLGASNREGLNYQQIREIKLPIPKLEDDAEFNKIYSVLTSINKKLEILKANWKKETSLKTGLMQDLLSGRVRVRVKIKEETIVNP